MESWTALDREPISSLKLTLNIAYPDAVSNNAWVAMCRNFEQPHVTAFCLRMWLNFWAATFFGQTKVDSERSSWILGCRLFLLSASRTPPFLAVNPVSSSAQHPAHTGKLHDLRRAPLLFSTEIPDTWPRSAQPPILVAIFLLNVASHPVFLAVHSCRSARCGQTRICSALSRLGIYVFSCGVYRVACGSHRGHWG